MRYLSQALSGGYSKTEVSVSMGQLPCGKNNPYNAEATNETEKRTTGKYSAAPFAGTICEYAEIEL